MTWLDRTLVETPYDFCLCVTEKQYHRELKRLNIPKDLWGEYTIGGKGATLHSFTRKDGRPLAFVNLKVRDGVTLFQVHAMLVHEAVHLWQNTREHLGEDAPSAEFEAYAVQAMSQRLFYAYDELTSKRRKK